MNEINIPLSSGYRLKSLTDKDIDIISELCDQCSDYYILAEGQLPSKATAEEIFTDLPPNKDYKDKYVLGIYQLDQRLVGLIDIVKDYPMDGEWIIGLLLIEPNERGNGLGSLVHSALKEWAIDMGARSFRIGVVQDNVKAIGFWNSLGYQSINTVKTEIGVAKQIVDVMRLHLGK